MVMLSPPASRLSLEQKRLSSHQGREPSSPPRYHPAFRARRTLSQVRVERAPSREFSLRAYTCAQLTAGVPGLLTDPGGRIPAGGSACGSGGIFGVLASPARTDPGSLTDPSRLPVSLPPRHRLWCDYVTPAYDGQWPNS